MADARRAYLYPLALVGLAGFLGGMGYAVWQAAGQTEPAPTDAVLAGLVTPALLPWLALSFLGLLAWLTAWSIANRAARPLTLPGAAERAYTSRKMFLYAGQLLALAVAAALGYWSLRSAMLGLLALAGIGEVPSWPVFPAAASVVALITWGYLRWETLRDGDIGQEQGYGVGWRRTYTYIAALAGLVLSIAGAGELVRSVIRFAQRPLLADAPWRIAFASALAALITGLIVAVIGWRWSSRGAQVQPTVELNALSRVLLRHAGLLAGALITLVSLAYLIDQAILRGLGLQTGPWWSLALAYLPAGMIAWLTYSSGVRDDRALGGETARTATIRRVVRYALSAGGLAAFWFGMTEVARLVLQVVFATQAAGPAFDGRWWGRFALATALVLVGAPAWWGHWWPLQVRARMRSQSGHAERAADVRRAYLYLVILAGAAVVVFALGFGAFLALNWRAAGDLGGVWAAVAGALAAAIVALIWAASHALILRADERMLAADRATAPRAAAPLPAAPVPPPAALIAAEAPRQFRREELAGLAAGAGLAVAPGQNAAPMSAAAGRPAVAVIDGADGSAGAALLAGLRAALPDAALWPIGLNAAAHLAMLDPLGQDTPPHPPPDVLRAVDVIVGPSDIMTPGGMDGEVSDALLEALAASPALVLLLPPRDPRLRWVGAPDWPLTQWVENAVIEVQAALGGDSGADADRT